MAANWWKYGLCVFGGLGVGYLAGVKITKNKAEAEIEEKIADIREIYRNDRKAKAPKKAEKKEEPDRPETVTKTSIDIQKLSEKKKELAEEASNKYSKAFKESEKPALVSEKEDEDTPPKECKDYIHIVEDFPEDSTYDSETLKYYADGVLVHQVSGKKVPEKDIPHLVGEEALKRLAEDDECIEVRVMNDLYRMNYFIIFQYDKWSEVEKEEPYKATL